VTSDNIYCANVGDSRAIAVQKNGFVIELSHDHKPNDLIEKERVEKAGGFVD
jgi:serine/threonine protein phosphatase PrpC